MNLLGLVAALAAALCWGVTNPILRQQTTKLKLAGSFTQRLQQIWLHRFVLVSFDVSLLLFSICVLCAFKTGCQHNRLMTSLHLSVQATIATNQLGSVFFAASLRYLPISLASMGVNGLTFAITAASGAILGEHPPTRLEALGAVLVAFGATLCALD